MYTLFVVSEERACYIEDKGECEIEWTIRHLSQVFAQLRDMNDSWRFDNAQDIRRAGLILLPLSF